uniref:Sulfate_transp domain-containing protein n=1 Tax=Angiostrongylus cantonensis TaxID=6313 RepID=A0A0K0D816_ANGCA
MEMLCSLFPVWPSSTALARTLVYEAAGTKTQLATIFSSLVLLAVILFIGQLVESLPMCFLSCIIIVALKGMFMQLSSISNLWPISKTDCAVFTVCFAATVLYDVIEGLLIGTCFAAALLLYTIQKSKVVEIGRLSHNEGRSYFQPIDSYRFGLDLCCKFVIFDINEHGWALVFVDNVTHINSAYQEINDVEKQSAQRST